MTFWRSVHSVVVTCHSCSLSLLLLSYMLESIIIMESVDTQSQLSGKKRKGGVPIPSFSCVSPSKAESVPVNWNTASLTRAETALHINRIRRGPSKWTSDGVLKLDDFYTLSRQLSLVDTPMNSKQEDPDGLAPPERLLCDLVCVGSPSLYQMVQNDNKEWCLKMMEFKGNRVMALRQQIMESSNVDVAKRDALIKAIMDHRGMSTKQKVPKNHAKENKVTSPQKVILEPFIFQGMTLEDRIQARADAREQREAEATAKSKSDAPDHSHLLRLADAMWSHSRHTLRRESRNNQTRRFSLTVKQVVKLFAGSLVSSSSSRTAQLHREKATRSEMLEALLELQKLVPEWISFSSKNLAKDTLVWLSPTADFASVRSKLGAPKNTHVKQSLVTKKFAARVSLSPDFGRDKTVSASRGFAAPRKRPASNTLIASEQKRTRD